MTVPRYRLVPASEPDAEPVRRAPPKRGRRRRFDPGLLFAQLVDQRPIPRGEEFVFRGDPETLWEQLSRFVDEESKCSPFLTFEQVERVDGVLLRVTARAFSER